MRVDPRIPFDPIFAGGMLADAADGTLLQHFRDGSDGATGEAAFSALMARHGPMVWRVCQRTLGTSADAQDAFQATFLVLAARAGSIREADSVASWLHGVALRVAAKLKGDASRRQAHERRAAAALPASQRPANPPESFPELHEELDRLPRRDREVLILHYLEGLSTEELAWRLGCPRGTILSRLARGRDRLRARLTRRGLGPVAEPLASEPRAQAPPALVPPTLVGLTLRLVLGIGSQSAGPGGCSASVVHLTQGVLRMMFWTQVKTVGTCGLAVALFTISVRAGYRNQEPAGAGQVPSQPSASSQPVPARQALSAPPVPVPSDPTMPPLVVPLPPPEQLHPFLRRVASEAMDLARTNPEVSSWMLTTIATTQARAGDRDGARVTFDAAVREAEGGGGGAADAWSLWRIGRFQAKSGFQAEAQRTLGRACTALPGVTRNFDKDQWAVKSFAMIVQEQARLGQRAAARATADRMIEFTRELLRTSPITNTRAVIAFDVAPALAAVDDFEAAFGWSEQTEHDSDICGKIAVAAAECLDHESAQRFIAEAERRLTAIETADGACLGLSDLAEAHVRSGAIEAAQRPALAIVAIGQKIARDDSNGIDEPSYALLRVASVQREAGDRAGAMTTFDTAVRLVNEHSPMRRPDQWYWQVARGQLAGADIAGALRTVELMREMQAEILTSIAQAQAEAGQEAPARATFARARTAARLKAATPPGPDQPDSDPPGIVATPATRAGTMIARIEAMVGDVPGALKTLRALDQPIGQRFAFAEVVTERARAGDLAGALRLALEESKTPEERRASLEGIGRGVAARLPEPRKP